MRFTNLTRHTEIGANSYLLELAGQRVVLDCGMHPKHEGEDATARPAPRARRRTRRHSRHPRPPRPHRQPARAHAPPAPGAGVHESAHRAARRGAAAQFGQRHVPALRPGVRQRPRPCTAAAASCCSRTARPTSSRKSGSRARWGPAWTFEGDRRPVPGEADVSFEFFDAGHILGSAGVLIRAEGKRVFLHGRREFPRPDGQPAPPVFPGSMEEPIDTLIVETTRGDHPVPPGRTRARPRKRGWPAR